MLVRVPPVIITWLALVEKSPVCCERSDGRMGWENIGMVARKGSSDSGVGEEESFTCISTFEHANCVHDSCQLAQRQF